MHELLSYLNKLVDDGVDRQLISTFLNVLKNEWKSKDIIDTNFRFLEIKDLRDYFPWNYFLYSKEFLAKNLNSFIAKDLLKSSIAEFTTKSWFDQISIKTWNDELESKSYKDSVEKINQNPNSNKPKESKVLFDQVEDFVNWVKNVNGDIEYKKLISFLTTTNNLLYRSRFIELFSRYTYSHKVIEFFMFKEFLHYKVDFQLFKIIAKDKDLFLNNVELSYLLFKSLSNRRLEQKDILLDKNINITSNIRSYLTPKNTLKHDSKLSEFLKNTKDKIITLKGISKNLSLENLEIINEIQNTKLNEQFVLVGNKYLVDKEQYNIITHEIIPNVTTLLKKLDDGYYGCSYISSYFSNIFEKYNLNKKSRIIYLVLSSIDLNSLNIEIDIEKGILKKNCASPTFLWFSQICDDLEIFDEDFKNKYLIQKHFIPEAYIELFINDKSVVSPSWTNEIATSLDDTNNVNSIEEIPYIPIESKVESEIKIIDNEPEVAINSNETLPIQTVSEVNIITQNTSNENVALLKDLNKTIYPKEFIDEIGKLLENKNLWNEIRNDVSVQVIDFINTQVINFNNRFDDFETIFYKFLNFHFGKSTFVKYKEILQSLNENWISITENEFKEFIYKFKFNKYQITNYVELEKIYIHN